MSAASPEFVTLRYKKVVGLGLAFQAINFAQSEFMGHRVRFNVPVDYMNQYFFWERASGDYRPTGRFADEGRPLLEEEIADLPSFATFLEWSLGTKYTDVDGVADGLNYNSSALDTYNSSKRDEGVMNFALPDDVAGATATAEPVTHYSANDLVMAYVLYKCFGSSAFDAEDIVYNLEDAFGMLTSKALAEAVRDSLASEDELALTVLSAPTEPKAGQRGKVDDMFRALLASDPKRFFLNGKQITGLFETNYTNPDASGDIAATGNWCLKAGDIIEVPIKLYFTAPVTVLSVVDNAKEPSSDSPVNPETVVIKGEAGVDAETPYDPNDPEAAAANRANIMSIRLQLVCSSPINATGKTFASSEVVVEDFPVALPLKVVNQMNIVFYSGSYYPAQSALSLVVRGGTDVTIYSSADLPDGVSIDETTGVLSFTSTHDPLTGLPLDNAPAAPGRYPVTIDIESGSETISADIFISIDDGKGSSNAAAA